MAEAAEGLRRKGASRNVTAHFKEALALDPLNGMALRGLGALLAARRGLLRSVWNAVPGARGRRR